MKRFSNQLVYLLMILLSVGCVYTIPVGPHETQDAQRNERSQIDELVESGDYQTNEPEQFGFTREGFGATPPPKEEYNPTLPGVVQILH